LELEREDRLGLSPTAYKGQENRTNQESEVCRKTCVTRVHGSIMCNGLPMVTIVAF